MNRSAAWHDRQLAHAHACIAEADRAHTPEEIEAAERALGIHSGDPQASLPMIELSERRRA